jgi:hypothetical protein
MSTNNYQLSVLKENTVRGFVAFLERKRDVQHVSGNDGRVGSDGTVKIEEEL